jgi:ATP-dependent DNA ligase
MRQEAVIGGITEREGSRKFFGASMLGVYEGGRLCYVGNTGTGFSESMLKRVYGRLEPYFTDTCPFTPRPKASTGPVGKAEVCLRGSIPGMDFGRQNESTWLSRLAG